MEEDAFRLGVIAAVDAGNNVAAEQFKKEEHERLRQARSTGSTTNQPQPVPPSLRPDKLGMRDGRAIKLTDHRSEIERSLSMNRGLSRTDD